MYSCSTSFSPRVVRPTPSMLPARGGIQRSSTTRSPSRSSQQPWSHATSLMDAVCAPALGASMRPQDHAEQNGLLHDILVCLDGRQFGGLEGSGTAPRLNSSPTRRIDLRIDGALRVHALDVREMRAYLGHVPGFGLARDHDASSRHQRFLRGAEARRVLVEVLVKRPAQSTVYAVPSSSLSTRMVCGSLNSTLSMRPSSVMFLH